MSGAVDDPDVCQQVKWCEERHGHDGVHRRTLHDTFGVDLRTGRPAVVQAVLQGAATTDRNLVLVAGFTEIGLSWKTARDFGLLLRDQARANGAS